MLTQVQGVISEYATSGNFNLAKTGNFNLAIDNGRLYCSRERRGESHWSTALLTGSQSFRLNVRPFLGMNYWDCWLLSIALAHLLAHWQFGRQSCKSTTQGRPLLLWTSREAPRGPQGRSGSSLLLRRLMTSQIPKVLVTMSLTCPEHWGMSRDASAVTAQTDTLRSR